MRVFILLSFILSILGCSAAGVIHSSDPYQKVNNSYAMINQGRAIPAERFAKEALQEFEENNDAFGQGEAHVVLGLLYKSPVMKIQDKSIHHFIKAIESFGSINNYANLAKSKFGLANAYAQNNENKKQCEFYASSIADYKKAKQINPNESFKFNPSFSSFEEMVIAFKKEYCK